MAESVLHTTTDQLLEVDATLRTSLRAASTRMHQAGVPAADIPWTDDIVPDQPVKQKKMIEACAEGLRKRHLAAATPRAAAWMRSCAGPGSSSYLLQATEKTRVSDEQMQVAVALRPGGTSKIEEEPRRADATTWEDRANA